MAGLLELYSTSQNFGCIAFHSKSELEFRGWIPPFSFEDCTNPALMDVPIGSEAMLLSRWPVKGHGYCTNPQGHELPRSTHAEMGWLGQCSSSMLQQHPWRRRRRHCLAD